MTNGDSIDGMIMKDPKIREGSAIIKGTATPVSQIIYLLQGGWTEDSVRTNYPWISPEGIQAARVYYERHKEEVDAEVYLFQHPEKWLKRQGYAIVRKSGMNHIVKK